MLFTYCTIWSQQKPTASLGKTVVGSICGLKLDPKFVEYATVQLAETNTKPSALAPPLGSAVWLAVPLVPPETSPKGMSRLNPTLARGSIFKRLVSAFFSRFELRILPPSEVPPLGVTVEIGPVGIGGAEEFASSGKSSG